MPRINTLKQKLSSNKVAVGTWCEIASPTIANVIATSGMDFLIIDMEHGPMSYETSELMARSAEADGCWPIIRVTENSEATILRALELGTQAILVPHVEDADHAHAVVRASKYFPEGMRGLGPYTRNHNYSHDNLTQSLADTNKETFVGILVEGADGIKRLGDIARVPGLDLIYLGIYDISQSVGFPGQLRHPTVLNAVKTSAKIIADCGRAAGSYAPDLEYAQLLIDCGFQFVAYSVDCVAIRQHYLTALRTPVTNRNR